MGEHIASGLGQEHLAAGVAQSNSCGHTVGEQSEHTGLRGNGIHGDGEVNFDHLASRWVVSGHSTPTHKQQLLLLHCGIQHRRPSASNLQWYTYEFLLNPYLGKDSKGNPNFPDWPKLGTWPDAYYMGLDILDPTHKYQYVGVLACAIDRTNILTGGTRTAHPVR